MKNNWLKDEIDFYDFIWTEALNLCATHVNDELIEDFKKGGTKFDEMSRRIMEKFPTREDALKAFLTRHI